MRTLKQIEASRLNGAKSQGPRTEAGKQIRSQNSFKTGLYSQALVTRGEKLEDFETLRDEYYTHHSPQTPEERETLDTVIRLAWQLRRYAMVETHSWNLEIKAAELHVPAEMLEGNLFGSAFFHSDQRFARLNRMQAATQRNYKDALQNLELLKGARPAQPIEEETSSVELGFVPSTASDLGQPLPPANASDAGGPSALPPPLTIPDSVIKPKPPTMTPLTVAQLALDPARFPH